MSVNFFMCIIAYFGYTPINDQLNAHSTKTIELTKKPYTSDDLSESKQSTQDPLEFENIIDNITYSNPVDHDREVHTSSELPKRGSTKLDNLLAKLLLQISIHIDNEIYLKIKMMVYHPSKLSKDEIRVANRIDMREVSTCFNIVKNFSDEQKEGLILKFTSIFEQYTKCNQSIDKCHELIKIIIDNPSKSYELIKIIIDNQIKTN